MFKHLRSILSIGALMIGAACFAQVTTVYSIDFTQETPSFEANNSRITLSETDGLVFTNSDGGWFQFHIGEGISVNNRQFYTVKIVAKADPAVDFNVYFGNNGPDCGGRVNLTSEWQEVSYKAQAQANANNYFLSAQTAGYKGKVCIKSVTVTTGDEGLDSELLCMKASNIEKKTSLWDNQLNYEFDPKKEHGIYTFAFDVCGDNDGKAGVNWGMGAKVDPDGAWEQLWGGTNPLEHREPLFDVVKDTWKHYEFTYNISEMGVYDGKDVYQWLGVVKLEFGNTYEGTLYFDNIVLKAAGSDENLISNGDFSLFNLGKWSKGWQHTYDLSIDNGPEHPAVTRTRDANAIWFGEKVVIWGQGNVELDKGFFEDAVPGDVLRVEFKGDRYLQIIFGGWNNGACETSPWAGDLYDYVTVDGKSYATIVFKEGYNDYTREEEKTIDGVKQKVECRYNLFDLMKNGGIVIQGPDQTVYEVIYTPVNKIAFVDAENSISFNTNYAGKEGENWVVNNLKLKDAIKYQAENDFTAKYMEYTRNFGSDNWQAFYVPFNIEVSALDGKVAQLKGAEKVDGTLTLEWETIESGELTPNTPYIYKPNTTGEVRFTSENRTVKAAASASTSAGCATLTGIYVEKTDMADSNAYALSGGTFYRTSDNAKTLKPFRIFLEVAGVAPAKVMNVVNGGTTAVEGIINELPADATYYDLQGRKIQNPANGGIYINNGQKVIIR